MHTGPTGADLRWELGGISSNQAQSLRRWGFLRARSCQACWFHLFRFLLLRSNTGAPQFFLISLNSTRNHHCRAIAEQVATVLDMLITAVRQGELDVLGPDKPTARF